MSGHTETPWVIGWESKDEVCIETADGVRSFCTIWGKDNKANAKLIVHAVNNRDALVDALVDSQLCRGCESIRSCEHCPTWKKRRDALQTEREWEKL